MPIEQYLSISETELDHRFQAFGNFYVFQDAGKAYQCRSILVVVRRADTIIEPQSLLSRKPDLLAVMMNPGSSTPVDLSYVPPTVQHGREILPSLRLIDTKPDDTQYQLMRIMEAQNRDTLWVINLSDYREPKSKVFYKSLRSLPLETSIFHESRTAEFTSIDALVAVPSILAWGRSESIKKLALVALKRFENHNCFHDPEIFDARRPLFYHPLPQNRANRPIWLKRMIERMMVHI